MRRAVVGLARPCCVAAAAGSPAAGRDARIAAARGARAASARGVRRPRLDTRALEHVPLVGRSAAARSPPTTSSSGTCPGRSGSATASCGWSPSGAACAGADGRDLPVRLGHDQLGPAATTRARRSSRSATGGPRSGRGSPRGRGPVAGVLAAARRPRVASPRSTSWRCYGHGPDDGPDAPPLARRRRRGAATRGKRLGEPRLRPGWHRSPSTGGPGALRLARRRRASAGGCAGDAVPTSRCTWSLNLAVGGDWPGAPDAATPFPSALEIDYVKVSR